MRIGLVAWNALPAITSDLTPEESAASGLGRYRGEPFGGLETGMWTLAQALADIPDVTPVAHVVDPSFLAVTRRRVTVREVELHLHAERWQPIRRNVSRCLDLDRRRLRRWDGRLMWQVPLLAVTRPFRAADPDFRNGDPRVRTSNLDALVPFGNSAETAAAAITARRLEIPVWLSLQSNDDLDLDSSPPGQGESTTGAKRVAAGAIDGWLCQTDHQHRVVRSMGDTPAVIVRNPIDRRKWRCVALAGSRPKRVLWIGRYDDFHKRPALGLDIARRTPEIHYDMVTHRFDPDIESMIRRDRPSNVDLRDPVPFAAMPDRFARASVFLSTGSTSMEGFPNVLLQAAAAHVPIVSLHDHDGFLSRSGAGVATGGSIESAARWVDEYHQRRQFPDWDAVDAYLDRHHDPAAVARAVYDAVRSTERQRPTVREKAADESGQNRPT